MVQAQRNGQKDSRVLALHRRDGGRLWHTRRHFAAQHQVEDGERELRIVAGQTLGFLPPKPAL